MVVAGCAAAEKTSRTEAQPSSTVTYSVGDMEVKEGPSGKRSNAPKPTGTVQNTDNGPVDELVLLSTNDIEEYWQENFSKSLTGSFVPAQNKVSYDSEAASSPTICGDSVVGKANAFWCFGRSTMSWDRGAFVPAIQQYFGDVGVAALIAHEYGHGVTDMADLATRSTPGIVLEQQADCFAGEYIRWVAEGKSPRFEVSTGDGLNRVLAEVIASRDPDATMETADNLLEQGHGTALDRVSAFQMGFEEGTKSCAAIDLAEINKRRGDLPNVLTTDDTGNVQTGEVEINQETLSILTELMGEIFKPQNPPKMSFENTQCPGVKPTAPASYCPSDNTIYVDLPALQKAGETKDVYEDKALVAGDNTALSIVMSRYALAVQNDDKKPLDNDEAALRTACLTGIVHTEMSQPIELPSGRSLVLTAGLLTRPLAASDVNGTTVPSGFTRIKAFRSGLTGDKAQCYDKKFT